jgi:hypothetical protein
MNRDTRSSVHILYVSSAQQIEDNENRNMPINILENKKNHKRNRDRVVDKPCVKEIEKM